MTKDFSDIFAPSIHHPRDPRQAEFRAALEQRVAEHKARGASVVAISMTGFPASAVNLGWLQDRIRTAWEGSRRTMSDAERLRSNVEKQLPSVVQRLKNMSISLQPPHDVAPYVDLDVAFVTKDDMGWYEYGFCVRLFYAHAGPLMQ